MSARRHNFECFECRSLPLPEAVTVGSEARLLGFCCEVLVGVAVTRPLTAASAETRATVFIFGQVKLSGHQKTRSRFQKSDCRIKRARRRTKGSILYRASGYEKARKGITKSVEEEQPTERVSWQLARRKDDSKAKTSSKKKESRE